MRAVYIPIETTKRELHGKLFLALSLCKLGCTVFLGSKQEVSRYAKALGGGVYLDKGYHPGVSDDIYAELLMNKTKTVLLDEENAVDFADFQQLHQRFPRELFGLVSSIYLWGYRQWSELEAKHGIDAIKKVLVTGHPRFELLQDEYRYIYDLEKNRYLESYGDFILINTNFGLGNNVRSRDSVLRTYGSRFPQLERLVNYQAKQMKNFIDLAIFIKKNTPYNVVIRPHPEESLEPYCKKFNDLDGIFVDQKGSVVPAILASRAMVHHDCTTALECAMLGRDSIAYIPMLEADLTTDIPVRVSLTATNPEELLAHLRTDLHAGNNIDVDILRDYFNFPNDSRLQIAEDIFRQSSQSKEWRLAGRSRYYLINIVSRLHSLILGKSDALSRVKLDGLTMDACKAICSELEGSQFSMDYELKELNPHLFRLRARDCCS